MKKFNTLYWLKHEKAQIEDEINELTVLSAATMSGIPRSTKPSSPVERFNEHLEQLKERLQLNCAKIVTEKERIQDYIENIEDADIRVIARKRFVENKTYEKIGDELYIEKTTVYKKLKRYMESTEQKGNENEI